MNCSSYQHAFGVLSITSKKLVGNSLFTFVGVVLSSEEVCTYFKMYTYLPTIHPPSSAAQLTDMVRTSFPMALSTLLTVFLVFRLR